MASRQDEEPLGPRTQAGGQKAAAPEAPELKESFCLGFVLLCFLKRIFILRMGLCVFVCPCVHEGACRGQEKALDSLELELQGVVS